MTQSGGRRGVPPTDFEIATPRISLRAFVYGLLGVIVVLGVARGLMEVSPAKSGIRIFLAVLLGIGVAVVAAEMVLVPASRIVRRRHAERLQEIQEQDSAALWAGVAQENGLASRLGEMTLSSETLRYDSAPGSESFAVAWSGVERVVFLPKLDFLGKLHVHLRAGRHLAWWIRGDCRGAFDALVNIRESG